MFHGFEQYGTMYCSLQWPTNRLWIGLAVVFYRYASLLFNARWRRMRDETKGLQPRR